MPHAEQLQCLGLRRRGECKEAHIGQVAPLLHLRDDSVLDVLLFLLDFFHRFHISTRKHSLEALGALTRLRRVGLIHDHRKPFPWEFPDLLCNHRKLLERCDDDRLAGFEGLLELARGRINVLDHAHGLLELPDGPLELAVEDAAIRDHDDGVEHSFIRGIMQHRKLVGEPRDRVALAAPRAVLDEVPMTGPTPTCLLH